MVSFFLPLLFLTYFFSDSVDIRDISTRVIKEDKYMWGMCKKNPYVHFHYYEPSNPEERVKLNSFGFTSKYIDAIDK